MQPTGTGRTSTVSLIQLSGSGQTKTGITEPCFDEVPLPLDWPVYVSHAEASAYARWAGKSLPTEAQWHRAAYGSRDGFESALPLGQRGLRDGNAAISIFAGGIPRRSMPFRRAKAPSALRIAGNGWEWTSSTSLRRFLVSSRFRSIPGYSANFFDGKHYVIKGGSARTAACMLRRSFRNWFQPHYQLFTRASAA